MSTISELIQSAIAGAESSYDSDIEYGEEKTASEVISFDDNEIEKVASTLDFIARTGLSELIKEASHPALQSNQAAIDYSPEERNKIINPELGGLFNNAKGANIHTKKVSKKGVYKQASSDSVTLDRDTRKQLIKEALASRISGDKQ